MTRSRNDIKGAETPKSMVHPMAANNCCLVKVQVVGVSENVLFLGFSHKPGSVSL